MSVQVAWRQAMQEPLELAGLRVFARELATAGAEAGVDSVRTQ